MAKKKYPNTIFVKREQDGNDSYLLAHEEVTDAAEVGADVEVAVYTFSKVAKLKTRVTLG